MKKTERGHLSWKNKEEDCKYLGSGGTCTHPSKERGTKGADGKQYCRAEDAAKAVKK